jgi:hypothetical protein
MKKTFCLIIMFSFICLCSAASADFKAYPGAKVDNKATKESNEAALSAGMKGVKSTIYTTSDPFAKVTSFYKGIAKEYSMPMASGTAGKPKKHGKYDLYEAYFIFDGAKDLAGSKLWVKVQRPYIGEDIRDVTAIIVSEKK